MEIGPASQPLAIFTEWMKEAQSHAQIREATAMTLATSSKEGALHARVVLCKQWSEQGFVFFTNYQSQKGLDLQHNPRAAAVFYWDPLFRQVKISGSVSKTTRQVSVDYWNSRARDSQISQYISQQSRSAPSREFMQAEWKKAEQDFSNKAIPCPEHWGGYILQAESLEFWIGQPGRLHDRYEFEKTQKLWTFRRLYP